MMTNAELQAAIDWAAGRLAKQSWAATVATPIDERLYFDHLSELLKIQRERAAEKEGGSGESTFAAMQRRAILGE